MYKNQKIDKSQRRANLRLCFIMRKGGDIIDIVEKYRRSRKRRLWERMKSEPDVHEAARLAEILYIEYFKKLKQMLYKNSGNELTSEKRRDKIKLQGTLYKNVFKSLDYNYLEYLAEVFGIAVEAILTAPEDSLKELYELIYEENELHCDADGDINWITTKDGIHIPLNDEGKAVGGPLEGENFVLAKSEKSAESGTIREKENLKINLQLFAKISKEKFTNYALNPEKDFNKATAFKNALGYDLSNCENLIADIDKNFNISKAKQKGKNSYGSLYEQIMLLEGPNGKKANVCTSWIVENGDNEPRLTSVYVTSKKVTGNES